MWEAADQLRAALADHDRVCREIGGNRATGEVGAEAQYTLKRLKAHAESTTLHPERTVKEHDTAADLEAYDEWSHLNALKYELRALKERMHSLRQVLSSYQTQARTERDDR